MSTIYLTKFGNRVCIEFTCREGILTYFYSPFSYREYFQTTADMEHYLI